MLSMRLNLTFVFVLEVCAKPTIFLLLFLNFVRVPFDYRKRLVHMIIVLTSALLLPFVEMYQGVERILLLENVMRLHYKCGFRFFSYVD